MKLTCPKCNHDIILKKKAVGQFETHNKRGKMVAEAKFYVCAKCFHDFNVK